MFFYLNKTPYVDGVAFDCLELMFGKEEDCGRKQREERPITIKDIRPVRSVSGFPETVTDRIRQASPIHVPTWPIA